MYQRTTAFGNGLELPVPAICGHCTGRGTELPRVCMTINSRHLTVSSGTFIRKFIRSSSMAGTALVMRGNNQLVQNTTLPRR